LTLLLLLVLLYQQGCLQAAAPTLTSLLLL
jgi:hypothetical protein